MAVFSGWSRSTSSGFLEFVWEKVLLGHQVISASCREQPWGLKDSLVITSHRQGNPPAEETPQLQGRDEGAGEKKGEGEH